MATWELVADLPLRVEGYALEGREQDVSSDFTRKSTTIHLRGGEEEGRGEDVVYEVSDHEGPAGRRPGARARGRLDAGLVQ